MLMRIWGGILPAVVVAAIAAGLTISRAQEISPEPRLRRPIALALADDGRRLIIGERDAGCVSIVDLEKKTVVAEKRFANRLSDIHVHAEGKSILATDESSGELIAVRRDDLKLRELSRTRVGFSPVSVARSGDGRWVSVALLWPRRMVILDAADIDDAKPDVRRFHIDLPFAPRCQIALPSSPHVVVADAFGGQIAVVDLDARKVLRVRQLGGHNIRGITLDATGENLLLTHQFLNPTAATQKGEIQNGNVVRNLVRRIPVAGLIGASRTNIEDQVFSIGDIEAGAGDPAGLTIDDAGNTLVALAGVDELGIGRLDEVVWTRIPVGRGPTAVAFDAKTRRAFVANTFGDSISIVDCNANKVVGTIALTPKAPELTPAERGEILFHDAKRSHEGWMSCQSCHPLGHTNGKLNDNFSDGSFGTPKRVLSLLGSKDTGPWAWNAKVADLHDQIRTSFKSTMQGRPASDSEVSDVAAFLRTLSPPPSVAKARGELKGDAVGRGRQVFDRIGCVRCHAPPSYTTTKTYDVGLDSEAEYNPPSLRGVSQGGPYFHDGRAPDLNEVIRRVRHQVPANFPETDASDLLEFLNSL